MNTQPIYLALYRGRRNGTGWRVWFARAADRLTRKLTRGRYSHCEIAVRLGGTAAVVSKVTGSLTIQVLFDRLPINHLIQLQ